MKNTADHIVYRNDIRGVDPKYPNAWRGAATLVLSVAHTALRIRWIGRYTENDWMRVDPYKRINIAPKWAKWFSFVTYYAGDSRYMHHFSIGKFGISYIPLKCGTMPRTLL